MCPILCQRRSISARSDIHEGEVKWLANIISLSCVTRGYKHVEYWVIEYSVDESILNINYF